MYQRGADALLLSMGFSQRDRRAVMESWALARLYLDAHQLEDALVERWATPGRASVVEGSGRLPESSVCVVQVWPGRRHTDAVVEGALGLLHVQRAPWRLGVAPGAVGGESRVVVWVRDEELPRVADGLRELTRRRTVPCTPVFTCALAPGLSWAEVEPGEGFERCRARLLASALRSVPCRWGAPEVVDAVADRFRAAGIDPAAPHLRSRRLCGV